MSVRQTLAGLAFAATAALLVLPTYAIALPAAFGRVDSIVVDDADPANPIYLGESQLFAGSDLDVSYAALDASGRGTLSASPFPVLTTWASSAGILTVGAEVYSSLTYYLSVSGPANTYVPVAMQALLTLDATSLNADAQGHIFVGRASNFSPVYTQGANLAGFDGAHSQYAFNPTLNLLSNEVYIVALTSIASDAHVHPSDVVGYASSVVDPYFSIDAGFLGSNPGFSLQFSDGIGNAPNPDFPVVSGPGVPEPATWALMILGLGGVGAVVRRRRRAIDPA